MRMLPLRRIRMSHTDPAFSVSSRSAGVLDEPRARGSHGSVGIDGFTQDCCTNSQLPQLLEGDLPWK